MLNAVLKGTYFMYVHCIFIVVNKVIHVLYVHKYVYPRTYVRTYVYIVNHYYSLHVCIYVHSYVAIIKLFF